MVDDHLSVLNGAEERSDVADGPKAVRGLRLAEWRNMSLFEFNMAGKRTTSMDHLSPLAKEMISQQAMGRTLTH